MGADARGRCVVVVTAGGPTRGKPAMKASESMQGEGLDT